MNSFPINKQGTSLHSESQGFQPLKIQLFTI